MKIKKIDKDIEIMRNTEKSLQERKTAFARVDATIMNPKSKKDFDPETFDPLEDHPDYEVGKRPRTVPPKRLPTLGLKPKQIKEGQMVGMYESKQDLYLLIAWLADRVTDLEEEIERLRGA